MYPVEEDSSESVIDFGNLLLLASRAREANKEVMNGKIICLRRVLKQILV